MTRAVHPRLPVSSSTYTNYSCRCDGCSAAAAEYQAAYRARKRARDGVAWRRLAAGDALVRHPVTHRQMPCPDGAWRSPGGNVYWPDSMQAKSADARSAIEAAS